MIVTAQETFLSRSGRERARICRRNDGLFQVTHETFRDATDEEYAYWNNSYPPSGMFSRRDDAIAHLLEIVPDAVRLQDIKPCVFDLTIGPYPEPVQRMAE